ncbi:hypothetical protein [Arthrobacter sp. B2I5]|uniref:hypothetical protein n=1 Tax=Arthrobacter sp. B2I5 TaxID=3042266 RepID=UPI0027D85F50|nr:hypothetical protein [Arthrobacter sp. B2I5]
MAAADRPMTDWFVDHRTAAATAVLAGLAFVFGPLALPVITLVATTGWALLTRRLWRPLLLAGSMLTGVIVTEVIAHAIGRSRPPTALMMLGADATSSFPSGHVVGASNFLLIGAYLLFSPVLPHAVRHTGLRRCCRRPGAGSSKPRLPWLPLVY